MGAKGNAKTRREAIDVLVFACIAPHGGVSIPSLGNPKTDRAEGTRQAMAELAARARDVRIDAWIVIGPHGIRADGAFAVSDGERAHARFGPEGPEGEAFTFDAPVHRELARALTHAATSKAVPAIRVGDGMGDYPMDWSGAIPLSFLGAGSDGPPVVQVVPSTELTWDDMVRFGEVLAEVADSRAERIGLIASSDLAHAHDPEGPYGFDKNAAVYDQAVKEAIEAGDPLRLLTFDPDMVHAAMVDGQWPILVLAGALKRHPMRTRLLCYEVPTYFGMLSAICDEAASA